MEKIRISVKLDPGATIPQYMSEEAAGMDISANIPAPITLKSLERALVSTGVYLEIPKGYEVQVRPRSGLAIKHGITLLNTPGTIDSDYRGEIKVIMVNLSGESYTINSGERIAQLVLSKVYQGELIKVDILNSTARDIGGFGHTGK